MEYKDYYKTIGVSKKASQKEIKSAYRKLARKHHPDVNPNDPTAEERFKEINEAYQVLSDKEKRQKYDRFGSQWQQYRNTGGRPEDFNWSQWTQRAPGSSGGGTYRTVSQEDLSQMFGGGLGGFSDFFETLFGAGFGGRTASQRQPQARTRRIPDAEHTLEISLEEAYHGTTRTLQFEGGRRIEAKIPAGVRSGSRIRLSGQAGKKSATVNSGDLYLKIKILPHKQFKRRGDDLKIKLPINIYTAVLGGEINVPTMSKPVRLTIPAGTDSGKVFRLKELGMPSLKDPKKHGNLYATIEIHIPKHLTQAEKDRFTELKHMRR